MSAPRVDFPNWSDAWSSHAAPQVAAAQRPDEGEEWRDGRTAHFGLQGLQPEAQEEDGPEWSIDALAQMHSHYNWTPFVKQRRRQQQLQQQQQQQQDPHGFLSAPHSALRAAGALSAVSTPRRPAHLGVAPSSSSGFMDLSAITPRRPHVLRSAAPSPMLLSQATTPYTARHRSALDPETDADLPHSDSPEPACPFDSPTESECDEYFRRRPTSPPRHTAPPIKLYDPHTGRVVEHDATALAWNAEQQQHTLAQHPDDDFDEHDDDDDEREEDPVATSLDFGSPLHPLAPATPHSNPFPFGSPLRSDYGLSGGGGGGATVELRADAEFALTPALDRRAHAAAARTPGRGPVHQLGMPQQAFQHLSVVTPGRGATLAPPPASILKTPARKAAAASASAAAVRSSNFALSPCFASAAAAAASPGFGLSPLAPMGPQGDTMLEHEYEHEHVPLQLSFAQTVFSPTTGMPRFPTLQQETDGSHPPAAAVATASPLDIPTSSFPVGPGAPASKQRLVRFDVPASHNTTVNSSSSSSSNSSSIANATTDAPWAAAVPSSLSTMLFSHPQLHHHQLQHQHHHPHHPHPNSSLHSMHSLSLSDLESTRVPAEEEAASSSSGHAVPALAPAPGSSAPFRMDRLVKFSVGLSEGEADAANASLARSNNSSSSSSGGSANLTLLSQSMDASFVPLDPLDLTATTLPARRSTTLEPIAASPAPHAAHDNSSARSSTSSPGSSSSSSSSFAVPFTIVVDPPVTGGGPPTTVAAAAVTSDVGGGVAAADPQASFPDSSFHSSSSGSDAHSHSDASWATQSLSLSTSSPYANSSSTRTAASSLTPSLLRVPTGKKRQGGSSGTHVPSPHISVTRVHTHPSHTLRERARFHRKQRCLATGRRKRALLRIFPTAASPTATTPEARGTRASLSAHSPSAAASSPTERTLDFSDSALFEEHDDATWSTATSAPTLSAPPTTSRINLSLGQVQMTHPMRKPPIAAAAAAAASAPAPKQVELASALYGNVSAVLVEDEEDGEDGSATRSSSLHHHSSADASTVAYNDNDDGANASRHSPLHHGDADSFRAVNLSDTFEQLTLLPSTPHTHFGSRQAQHRKEDALPFATSPTRLGPAYTQYPDSKAQQQSTQTTRMEGGATTAHEPVVLSLLSQARLAGASTSAALASLETASSMAALYAKHVLGSNSTQSKTTRPQQQQQQHHPPPAAHHQSPHSRSSFPEIPPSSRPASPTSTAHKYAHSFVPTAPTDAAPAPFTLPVFSATPPSIFGTQQQQTHPAHPHGVAHFTPVQMYMCAWPMGQPMSAAYFSPMQQQSAHPQPQHPSNPFTHSSPVHTANTSHQWGSPTTFAHVRSPPPAVAKQRVHSPEQPSPSLASARDRFCAVLAAY